MAGTASAGNVPVPRGGAGGAGAVEGGIGGRSAVRGPLIPPMPNTSPRTPTADPAALPGSGSRVVGHMEAVREDDV
jgi:two-component system sensor histidine kinase MtrB